MAASAAMREAQHELETHANALSKLQKGILKKNPNPSSSPPFFPSPILRFSSSNFTSFCRYCQESPSEKAVYDPARRERARPQGISLSLSIYLT